MQFFKRRRDRRRQEQEERTRKFSFVSLRYNHMGELGFDIRQVSTINEIADAATFRVDFTSVKIIIL